MTDLYLNCLLPDYIILTQTGSSFGYEDTKLNRIKIRDNYTTYSGKKDRMF